MPRGTSPSHAPATPSPIAHPRDPSEHIPGRGFDCDCDGCLKAGQAAREEAARLANPDHYARARISDPARVVDIAEARRRAMPGAISYIGDGQATVFPIWPAEHLGDFRGQVAPPSLPTWVSVEPPQRPKHLGLVMFWLGCALATLCLWLVVRLGGGQ